MPNHAKVHFLTSHLNNYNSLLTVCRGRDFRGAALMHVGSFSDESFNPGEEEEDVAEE